MIAHYRELDYSTAWSNWAEHSRYTRRRYAKYSASRLSIEALCYAVLTFSARCAMQLSVVPRTGWVVIAGQILTVSAVGFSILSVLALLVTCDLGMADLLRGLSVPRPLSISGSAASNSVLPAGAGPAVGEPRPPMTPNILLELLLPRRDRAVVIGDLEETYRNELLPKYGRKTAATLYWVRCVREALFYSWPLLKKMVPWGIVAATICTGKLKWLAEVVQQLAR